MVDVGYGDEITDALYCVVGDCGFVHTSQVELLGDNRIRGTFERGGVSLTIEAQLQSRSKGQLRLTYTRPSDSEEPFQVVREYDLKHKDLVASIFYTFQMRDGSFYQLIDLPEDETDKPNRVGTYWIINQSTYAIEPIRGGITGMGLLRLEGENLHYVQYFRTREEAERLVRRQLDLLYTDYSLQAQNIKELAKKSVDYEPTMVEGMTPGQVQMELRFMPKFFLLRDF